MVAQVQPSKGARNVVSCLVAGCRTQLSAFHSQKSRQGVTRIIFSSLQHKLRRLGDIRIGLYSARMPSRTPKLAPPTELGKTAVCQLRATGCSTTLHCARLLVHLRLCPFARGRRWTEPHSRAPRSSRPWRAAGRGPSPGASQSPTRSGSLRHPRQDGGSSGVTLCVPRSRAFFYFIARRR